MNSHNKILVLFVMICSFAQGLKGQNCPPADCSPALKTTAKAKITKYGVGSYYAQKFEGRRTTMGEIFRCSLLTCACNVLPLGTMVRVTNLKNNRSVILKVNDRLYYKNKRLVDLTPRAARQLGYIGEGITKVKVEVL